MTTQASGLGGPSWLELSLTFFFLVVTGSLLWYHVEKYLAKKEHERQVTLVRNTTRALGVGLVATAGALKLRDLLAAATRLEKLERERFMEQMSRFLPREHSRGQGLAGLAARGGGDPDLVQPDDAAADAEAEADAEVAAPAEPREGPLAVPQDAPRELAAAVEPAQAAVVPVVEPRGAQTPSTLPAEAKVA